ncbi:myosin phosphatase Rho interacting protein outspread isoform 2-T5 [Cochliomyia hominivorax]
MSSSTAAATSPSTLTTTTSTSTTRTSDCRKFSPNIFNKSKCSHCFRQREEHSAAALECNRASRKVSKCGYLFVAPDWDFSNPLYRTKRWQRRWFVLYDDGELTYSVDEHPETVPQACIDMTKVLEVTTAEDVTGHTNSIAITAPDRVTFVKGTCPEESKWWLNILAAFPKSKGRHKRNATFPGAQATTILQSTNSDAAAVSATARNRHNSYHKDILTSTQSTGVLASTTVSSTSATTTAKSSSSTATSAAMASKQEKKSSNIKSISNNKNNMNGSSKLWSHNDVVVTTKKATTASSKNATGIKNNHNVDVRNVAVNDDDEDDDEDDEDEDDEDEEDDGVETGEDEEEDECDEEEESGNSTGEECNTKKKSSMAGTSVHDENNRNAVNEIKNRVSPPCLLIEDIRRDEKTIKDLANTITNLSQQQKNRWTTTAVNNVLNTHLHQHGSSNSNNNNNKTQQQQLDDNNCRDETDFYRPNTKHSTSSALDSTQSHLRPKSLPLASNSTPAIVSAIVKKIPPVMVSSSNQANTTTTNNNVNSSNNNSNNNRIKSSPRYQIQQLQSNQNLNRRQQKQQALERGDPDGGCNLDDLSSNYLAKTVELRVNPPPPSSPASSLATQTSTNIATPPTTNSGIVESLNAKKGWLMKQDNRTGDWTKHWFTLSGAALFYYRDPVSEERGVLDGVLDVNSLTNVAEVNANRNYAFQLTTWDKRRLTLASLSPNSRNSWIAVLRNAAGLQQNPAVVIQNSGSSNITGNSGCNNSGLIKHSSALTTNENHNVGNNKSMATTTELIIKDNTSDDMKSEIEKDFIKAQRINNNNNNNSNNKSVKKLSTETSPQVIITNVSSSSSAKSSLISPQTPITPKTALHFSSDEEYRTASEGGRRDSIGDWGSPLSPSPPAPLNILRAKDRMRPRTTTPCPRMHKRSRSSPPSSRRSTVDSVGSDELPIIHTVHEEINLNVDKELQFRLSVVEKERDMLRDEAKERETRMSELLNTLERTEQELTNRIHEMEEVRESLNTQLVDAQRNASEIIERLTDELDDSQRKIKDLEDRLARGIEENENLYKRLREMESYSPASFINLQKSKMKRMDSLSDLTQINDIDPYGLERDSLAEEYSELKSRFEKAVNEIRAMKRELKESQNQYDSLEISYASLKQDLERKEIEDQSQLQMMAARIQDLTLKYSSSERQVRTLKQKLAKSERRRSLSLKGKEQLTVSKELEVKLGELEHKIDELEKTHQMDIKQPIMENPQQPRSSVKKSHRRRSLDASLSAVGSSESLQFLVRINDLEKRCEGVNSSRSSSCTPTPNSTTPNLDSPSRASPAGNLRLSEHLVERLRCLESVLVTSKDRLEQSLSQLQNLRSSRTRRSVSPITERKDSYRFVERCLHDVVKLIRESTETCVVQSSHHELPQPSVYMLPDSSPVKKALTQLESQLRSKLAELLKQRRMLRERNELTKRKDLELLAERIAFESVCFGKLRDSVERAENPELFCERQTRAEVAETSHLMSMLKAKLQGKCTVKTSGSLDILAGVLARRLLLSSYQKTHGQQQQDVKLTMEPVDQNMLDDLLRQQNEINVIAKRYKNNAMENLATSLAAETLSYMSTNDLVQGAVQEAWRQAQETVNAELVQSEIAHIMMRNAERLESSVTPSFGYTLTSEERLSFEKFADAVHDALRREMEFAVTQLTQCYEETMQQMKRGQWRMHLQHEHKASEGRQLLTEFADIIAHKALVDARIDVLRGDYASQQSSSKLDEEKEVKHLGITTLQKYENLFEELSNDLQINNPDDILLEADFEFMYKQHAVDFLSDRQVLCDISTFLSQLEDSLIALQCEATTSTNEHIPRTEISIESLQDVCHKCCELRKRADQLLQEVHRKLNASCQHCLQVREKLHSLQEQHESEILRLQQSHAKDLTALMQQVEHQRTAIRCLEAEKNAINQDLNKSEELMEERERELQAVTQKLNAKDQTLQATQGEQCELLKRLEAEEEKVRSYQEESDALTMKCARQDDEYVMLLQERDYIQAQLAKEQERSRRFEKRLELLEMEHGKQMECLQQAYRDQMLAHCSELPNVVDEESFRQRYQSEIEQLRTLCEKGLSAMESSHRRTINDLEEKHKQEIERLLIEKETALAEETQATLAALDAMRKAHQSEVQREVARFKQEFLKQFQQKGERSLDSTKAKEEELEELRQEILSFSEKYSIKCVENAALEEKLRVANQKLKHFQQMQQLELRNKQFRAHLASEDPSQDIQFVTRPKDGEDDNGDAVCQDSEHVHAKNSNHNDNDAKIYKQEQLLKSQQQQQESYQEPRQQLQYCYDNNNEEEQQHQQQMHDQQHQRQQKQLTLIKPLLCTTTQIIKSSSPNDLNSHNINNEHNNYVDDDHNKSKIAKSSSHFTPNLTIPHTKLATNETISIQQHNNKQENNNNTLHNITSTTSFPPNNSNNNNSNDYNTITITHKQHIDHNNDNNNTMVVNPAAATTTANVNNDNDTKVILQNITHNSSRCKNSPSCSSSNNNSSSCSTSSGIVGGGGDGLDDDYLTNCRYSYEPCYKQTNLFNYQNRMLNFEGLKTTTRTTFGKNLKTFKNQYKLNSTKNNILTTTIISPTTTTTTSSSSTTTTTTTTATTKLNKNEQEQKPQIFKSIKTFQIQDNIHNEQTPTTTTKTISTFQLQNEANPTTKIKSILNPVDLPKNFSANNTININLNSFIIDMEKQQLNNNHNNNNNNKNQQKFYNNNKTTTHLFNNNSNNINNNTTTTTNDKKNITIAERCSAINLNSFSDIIQKATSNSNNTSTPTTATLVKHVGDDDIKVCDDDKQQHQQNNNDSNMFVETTASASKTTIKPTCSSYNLLTQQQHALKQHQQQQQQHHISSIQDMDNTTLKTKRSRISSPPPLDGRDVELTSNNTTTPLCTSSTNNTISNISNNNNNIINNPTLNSTKSLRNTSSHLKRFELEI